MPIRKFPTFRTVKICAGQLALHYFSSLLAIFIISVWGIDEDEFDVMFNGTARWPQLHIDALHRHGFNGRVSIMRRRQETCIYRFEAARLEQLSLTRG